MAFNLKLPNFLSGTKGSAGHTISDVTVMEDGSPTDKQTKVVGLDIFNQYPVAKKLKILGGVLVVLIIVIALVIANDQRKSSYNTAYVATSGEMRMISQRLAKASTLALQGDSSAFNQLRDSHKKFATDLERLTNGGELFNLTVPPSPDSTKQQLDALALDWEKTNKNTLVLFDLEKVLVSLGVGAKTINEKNANLLELAEQVVALKLQTNAGAREIVAASQMEMLTQRIAKNAGSLLVGEEISPEMTFMFGKDSHTFAQLLTALIQGSEVMHISAATDAETKSKLAELESSFKEYHEIVSNIMGNLDRLVVAKQAGSRIFRDSEALLEDTNALSAAYEANAGERTVYTISLSVLVLLSIGSLALMVWVYLEDSHHQTEAAEASRLASEALNRQNQDAILRLMNELGDLADGDLTVTATVSEDITGAIADSINYTVEELRVLVMRINDAAGRVTSSTEIAKQTSAELLAAAERQSIEIQQAGRSVLDMASTMNKVSGDANQSALVARQSLAAAGKGTQAVQDSIKGMNEIREQIQETSKRIKRLGESSQEIGEIVELISDITEQTNVLALNAAIQAASAGEAGRGFTVVAEEVQRLAERSGEATKQIAAIVKTIQTDTQGAVSAMEESTRGVVEGAKLSDAAGQALNEIGEVSENLSELIQDISNATRQQADAATGVESKMQDILRVTEQTTAGTQKTAASIGELASLATELKGSVAGFKVG